MVPKFPMKKIFYPQNPGVVHPLFWLDGLPFYEEMYCVKCYTQQPAPLAGVVGHQEERLQDILRLKYGYCELIYLFIGQGLLVVHFIAVI